MSSDPHRDLVELRDLVDRYGVYLDAREYRKVADLFTVDGKLITSVPSEAVGRDEIGTSFEPALEWFADRHGLVAARLATQHLVGNHVCELDGDEATGVALCLARLGDPGAEPPVALVNVLRYEDVYKRTADGWRIETRKLIRLWTERPEVTG